MMQTGAAAPVSEACGQSLFIASQFLDWGAPVASGGLGDANFAPVSGPLTATTSGGIGVSVSSANDQLQRADNTVYAWDDNLGWTFPTLIAQETNPNETIYTFGGHFNAPSQETMSPSGVNPFGDNLLGAIAPSGPAVGNATLALTFSTLISGAEFQVSDRSGTNSDFVATLQAFNASGTLIGIYSYDSNGAANGGGCTGLNNPGIAPNFSDPVPCNDAGLIQFYDPTAQIKTVLLTVNDIQGAYIDTLMVNQSAVGAPEPAAIWLTGLGLALGFAVKRHRLATGRLHGSTRN